MKPTERTKFVNEVETVEEISGVRGPFKIEEKQQRKFIRLNISAPMSLQTLRDNNGGFWPEGEERVVQGLILNISAGGVLVDLNEAIGNGDVVAMRFVMQDTESVDDVLGLVKRVDSSPEGCITGIQFITREQLSDIFSQAEIDLIPDTFKAFDESVRTVLEKFICHKKNSA